MVNYRRNLKKCYYEEKNRKLLEFYETKKIKEGLKQLHKYGLKE